MRTDLIVIGDEPIVRGGGLLGLLTGELLMPPGKGSGRDQQCSGSGTGSVWRATLGVSVSN